MGLAGPGLADEHDRLRPLDVAALGQRLDLGGRDAWRLAEVELVERLDPWQVGILESPGDGVPLALLQLGLEERVEVAQVAVMLALGLLGETGTLPADGREVELLAVLLDDGLGQRRRLWTSVAVALTGWPPARAPAVSYSPTVGSGRSNWASSPTSIVGAGVLKALRRHEVTHRRLVGAAQTSAASIAPCSFACPCVRPSWSRPIIAFVPAWRPWRRSAPARSGRSSPASGRAVATAPAACSRPGRRACAPARPGSVRGRGSPGSGRSCRS